MTSASKKNLMAIGALIFMAFWIIIGLIMSYKEVMPVKENLSGVQIDDSSLYTWDLSETDIGSFIKIEGWFVKNGQDTEFVTLKMSVVYYDESRDIWFVLPTDVAENKQAREVMNDGLKYKWSGVTAKCLESALGKGASFKKYMLYELNGERKLVALDNL